MYVVKVMDTAGKIDFRALTADEYKKVKATLKKDYLAKGKAWLAAKKKAESDGAEFTDAKPVQPKYRALDKLASRANAQKLAQKYQKKHEEEQKAKEKTASL